MILIYLYIVVIFIRPQDWVPLFHGLPISLIVIPAGFLVGVFQSRKISVLSLPQSKLMIAYFIIIVISIIVNGLGFEYLTTSGRMWLQRLLLFFMVVLLVNNEEKLKKATWFFLIIISLLSVQAIQQGVTGVGWNGVTPYPGYTEIRVRWLGDWDGPNVYALIMAVGVPILFEMFLNGSKNWFLRLLYLVLIANLFLGVYFTNSRGAVLGVGVAICLQLMFKYVRNIGSLVKYAVIISVLIVFAMGVLPSRMSKVTSSESSASERTWLWENGLIMLRHNPVIGVGKGQFQHRSPLQLRAHNNFVQVFAETGFSGFFIFIAILWFTCHRLLKCHLNNLDSSFSLIVRGLIFAILSYSAITFFVTMENDALFILLGLLVSGYFITLNKAEFEIDSKIRGKDVLAIFGIMLVIIFMVWLAAIKEIL